MEVLVQTQLTHSLGVSCCVASYTYPKLTYTSTVVAVVEFRSLNGLLHFGREVEKLGLDRPEQCDRVESGVCLSGVVVILVASLP